MELRVTQTRLAMRSNAGVGITPPKVLGAPKPQSSVMMSSTLGAPLGGTTRGGQTAWTQLAFSLITPPNFGDGGGGSCFPSMVVVALGEPGCQLISWALAIRLPAEITGRPRPIQENLDLIEFL